MERMQAAPLIATTIVGEYGKYLDVLMGAVELFGGAAWAATVGYANADYVALTAGGLIALLGFGRVYRGLKKFSFAQPQEVKPRKLKKNDYDELALREEVKPIAAVAAVEANPTPVPVEQSRAASVLARVARGKKEAEGSA